MATLHFFKRHDDTYDAALMGIGGTGAYSVVDPTYYTAEADPRPYKALLDQVQTVFVQSTITGIGDFVLALFRNAKKIVFEDPASIQSLGSLALGFSSFKGEISLPGLNGSTMGDALAGCGRLEKVDLSGTLIQELESRAFLKCTKLRELSGIQQVTQIWDECFEHCAELRETDLSPEICEGVGARAFHLTPVGTAAGFENTKFTEAELEAIRGVRLKDVDLRPVYTDQQSRYDQIPYAAVLNLLTGEVFSQSIQETGCPALSCYHAWNALHPGAEKESFEMWWNGVVKAEESTDATDLVSAGLIEEAYLQNATVVDGRYYLKLYHFPFHMKEGGVLHEIYRRLGWAVETGGGAVGCSTMYAHGAEAKQAIKDSLIRGFPVLATISKVSYGADHAVCIVGAHDDRLIVVDSSAWSGTKGTVYEMAFEDLFCGEGTGSINDITIIQEVVR